MCRSTELHDIPSNDHETSLKITAFFVRFKGFNNSSCKLSSPEPLTLLYLPHGSDVCVDGSKIRPDTAAFLTLHRIVNVKAKEGEAVFGSRERVWANGAVRFEIYLGSEKVLEGIFKRDRKGEWKLDCEGCAAMEVAAAEMDVCVAVDGQVMLGGRVDMASRRRTRKKKKNKRRGFDTLEVIPEEKEEGDEECCCDCKSNGGDLEEPCGPDCDFTMEKDLEGVRWAVDIGLWVMCLGVGYLVSKASSKSLRRLRLF